MEKEVVVAADVDEEEELSKVFKFVNLLWLHGLIDGETLEEARKISSQCQGYHENEVSLGGEADLHRHYIRCQKNPGHRQFIPVRDFKMEHLAPDHHDNDIFDFIKAEVDMTCRLRVMCTSGNRPKYHPIRTHLLYPFSQFRDRPVMRAGTGLLNKVFKYTDNDNKPCECYGCKRAGTHTPCKVWGKVEIGTAMHVVYDDHEARCTTCYFGYDTSTTLLHKCLKLTGFRVAGSNNMGDGCVLTYVTHDMKIINKLYEMYWHHHCLYNKLLLKHIHNMNTGPPVPCPVVIISHPHGCSKHITVGEWTHKQTWGETCKYKVEGLEIF